MKKWIDRVAALELLGVKPQTLYAYVSRGRIRMEPDPLDSRRSLYNKEDIVQLTTRRSRGRKQTVIAASTMAWGEPAIATSISTVHRGRLYYRGQDAIELARSASLEDIAAILWDCGEPVCFPAPASISDHVFTTLASLAAEAQPILGRGQESLVRAAAATVGAITVQCGAASGEDPLHLRLARGWNCDVRGAEMIRRAFVVMADHDLNASTFAARVAASTGASLPASMLAGLCALSGPRHGGAARALTELLADAATMGAKSAIDRWLNRGMEVPGFGHPLYPGGDPRGALLLEGLELTPSLVEFRDVMFARTGLLPNCDFGLAALVDLLRLPQDAPFRLFLIARSVGWSTHAMEQNQSGTLIRPRGRYEGIQPVHAQG